MLAAQALQEALVAATRDLNDRARAVSALRGAEVYATTWPTDPSSLRTLLNSSGVRALALFTDERQLEEAALRFGWHGVDGSVPTRRLHISEAIRAARQQQVSLVIVDITSDHTLELDQGEIELVSAPPSTRPPSYQGLGPVVHSVRQVDNTNELMRVSSRPPPTNEHVSALEPSAVNIDSANKQVTATFAIAVTATMAALPEAPADDLIDGLSAVLREYPEVEWACLVGEEDSDRGAVHVALRIDTAFRKNLSEISGKLRASSIAHGKPLDVLVLDTPEQMKRARAIGLPFYPWRKR
ncbi:MAG TPA: SseB family protein [Polyangiales bacterium]|nr:SseB family protein [Polyangiales bacterium]